MTDPVCTVDGHTYERSAIAEWLRRRRTSPTTNLVLPSIQLTQNHALRSAIETWREQRPEIKIVRMSQQDLEMAVALQQSEMETKMAGVASNMSRIEEENKILWDVVRQLGAEEDVIALLPDNARAFPGPPQAVEYAPEVVEGGISGSASASAVQVRNPYASASADVRPLCASHGGSSSSGLPKGAGGVAGYVGSNVNNSNNVSSGERMTKRRQSWDAILEHVQQDVHEGSSARTRDPSEGACDDDPDIATLQRLRDLHLQRGADRSRRPVAASDRPRSTWSGVPTRSGDDDIVGHRTAGELRANSDDRTRRASLRALDIISHTTWSSDLRPQINEITSELVQAAFQEGESFRSPS